MSTTKIRTRIPALTKHSTGQARVRLNGRDVYCGLWGSPEAEAKYRRVVADFIASGIVPESRRQAGHTEPLVGDLILAYVTDCKRRLKARSFSASIQPVLKQFRPAYAMLPVNAFTARDLVAHRETLMQDAMDAGKPLSRSYVNDKLTAVIRRLFKWGHARGIVNAETWLAVQSVEPVAYNHPLVVRRPRVRPVSADDVENTLGELPSVVRDMVEVQRWTGARPAEVCGMRWADIDTTGKVWVCRPQEHKTAHHGHDREILIPARVQSILEKYLYRPTSATIFSPIDSERQRRMELRMHRMTPVQPSQRQRGQDRAQNEGKRQRAPKDNYTTTSYAQAIARAAERAGVEHWAPNQLRHLRLTEVRNEFGIEAAAGIAGHTRLETTQVYAAQKNTEALKSALAAS